MRGLLRRRRLLLAGLLVLLPVLVASQAYFTQQTRSQSAFHEQERRGLEYIRPVSALLAVMLDSLGAAAGPDGDRAVPDAAVAAVDAVDREHGQALATTERWRRWKVQLEQMQSHRSPSLAEFTALSDGLTDGLTDLLRHVATTSNLILDPDVDSYYLMDVVVLKLPTLLDELPHVAEVTQGGSPVATDRDRLVVARAIIDSAGAAIATDLATATESAADPAVGAALVAPGAAFQTAVERTSQTLGAVLVGQHPSPDAARLVAAAGALGTVCIDQMDALFAQRIDAATRSTRTIRGVLVVLAALLLVLAGALARALGAIGQKNDELRHQTLHDALTGLPNRVLVLDRVEQALARVHRGSGALAVMFLDLDGFKSVNDTYGHAAGDQLLMAVSARLRGALRETDTVGRLGGDEFVVVLEGASLARGPEAIADRLRAVLAETFELDDAPGVHLRAHASIGIAVGARATGAELLRDADVALYEAKSAGKDCYVLFAPQMQRAVQDRLELELDLRRALGTEELSLEYQPTVDLRTERITGVEALLRWNHPTRGAVPPEVFFPVADESELSALIGRQVLAEACREGARWQRSGHPLSVAVNLSGRHLDRRGGLLTDVRTALDSSGMDPRLLTLEITETMLMRDAEGSAQLLRELRQLGLRVAIDDFGTGSTSLAHLQQFPVDILKIDGRFIRDVAASTKSRALVHTFVELGRTFGLETWAEGIEHVSQLRCLQSEGCDSGQGYLFARPLSAATLADRVTGPDSAWRRSAVARP